MKYYECKPAHKSKPLVFANDRLVIDVIWDMERFPTETHMRLFTSLTVKEQCFICLDLPVSDVAPNSMPVVEFQREAYTYRTNTLFMLFKVWDCVFIKDAFFRFLTYFELEEFFEKWNCKLILITSKRFKFTERRGENRRRPWNHVPGWTQSCTQRLARWPLDLCHNNCPENSELLLVGGIGSSCKTIFGSAWPCNSVYRF